MTVSFSDHRHDRFYLLYFCSEYFEVKARLNQNLDDQKRQIQVIEETISMTKRGYADSLKELERISEEIHERRRKQRNISGLSFGHFNENSRQKKLKLKSEKLKTREQKTKNSRIFSKH